MGSYNSQYENYYNNLLGRNKKGKSYYSGGIKYKNKFLKKLAGILKFQLIGTMMLFSAMICLKEIVTPDTKAAYAYCKNVVNEDLDYKPILNKVETVDLNDIPSYVNETNLNKVEAKAVNFIENLRAQITGSKTISEEIKQDYSAPLTGKVLSPYGYVNGEKKEFHKGVDIEANLGSSVKTVYNGTVEEVGKDKTLGQYITIDNGGGVETKYCNLSEVSVKNGDGVTKGEIIGKSGDKLENEAPHLHFEIMYMGENKDPEEYFKFN